MRTRDKLIAMCLLLGTLSMPTYACTGDYQIREFGASVRLDEPRLVVEDGITPYQLFTGKIPPTTVKINDAICYKPTVQILKGGNTIEFQVMYSGYYSLLSRGTVDVDALLIDKEKGLSWIDKDSGHDKNFLITAYLEKGKTYILRTVGEQGEYAISMARGLPTSGYEYEYNPNLYENNDVQFNNNCYTYVLGLKRNPLTGWSFPYNGINPGWFANRPLSMGNLMSNRQIVKDRVEKGCRDDFKVFKNGNFRQLKTFEMPDVGHYKVALFLFQNGEKADIHWYRQDKDGTWSHKQGVLPFEKEDNTRQCITIPHASDNGIYKDFIGYYQFPNLRQFTNLRGEQLQKIFN